MITTCAYLDASAAVKLLVREPETDALRAVLRSIPACVSSELLEVELRCAAHRMGGQDLFGRADHVLASLDLVPYTAAVRVRAGEPFTPPQRALDALHLATALDLRLDGLLLISYDRDQLAAATAEGLRVATPGAA